MFYDNRPGYAKKWMATVYVKQRRGPKKVKSLGRFDTMIQAAEASAKARKKKAIKEIRMKKKAIYKTRVGKDLAEGRFKILARIFVNHYVGKKCCPAVPPDYEKSEILMKTPAQKKMFLNFKCGDHIFHFSSS